jgi:NAD(P)-dependent dehydrogenase (short-subunit alcohol dehydrogenase family)
MSVLLTKAIVTGHSRGLGEAIAEALLGRGIAVLALARRRNAALAARFPNQLEEVELDLADLASVERWLASDALQRFSSGAGTLLLVNNAGMLQPVGALEQQDAGSIARAVSLNVATPLMFSAALANASSEAKERRIVHVSSGAARVAYPGWSIYCATKAALDHHARAVALDASRALRIASVAPGVVDTDMQGEIRSTGLERFPLREKFDALKREGLLATPVQAAKKLVDYALSETFGSAPVMDVRELP